jgi:hypothetical protein
MNKLRQKVASLVSAAIFLGILYALFSRLIIIVRVDVPWWAFIVMLVALFFVIDFFVSRAVGARSAVERKADSASELISRASENDTLDEVKRKLKDRGFS